MKSVIKKLVRKLRGEVDMNSLVEAGLKVGKNFHRQSGVIIDPSHCWLITIGDNVTIAPRVYILAHDASTKQYLGYTKIGKVTIGNEVFIGTNSTILPNVNIGNNVIIGAASVVTKNIPDNSLAVGNPARIVGKTDEYILKNRTMMETRPVFDKKWTTRENITGLQKKEMNEKLEDGIGFVE